MYRDTNKLQREHILWLNEDITYIDSTQSMDEYIGGTDWRINANANTGYSNAGLINNLAGKVIVNYWLDKVYSKEEGYAHRNGDYHIHDLDCLTGYCAGWSLRALLNEGFNGVRGRVESSPPRHFREALGQMANFLGTLKVSGQGLWLPMLDFIGNKLTQFQERSGNLYNLEATPAESTTYRFAKEDKKV